VTFLVVIALTAGILYANMMRGLKGLGLSLSLDFLRLEAGFGIAEGIAFNPSDTYLKAFLAGVINTVRVSVVGIVLATALGLTFGIARLSSNWLVRMIAWAYVECFRNIPLLLQILFWYTAVILQLPSVRQSRVLLDSVFINQRGIYVPRPYPASGFGVWVGYLVIGICAAAFLYLIMSRKRRLSNSSTSIAKWALLIIIAFGVAGWYLAPQNPIKFNVPTLQRFNFIGGLRLSPELSALLIGLSVYTGAFISEVVRGGIQAVAKGQIEAASALGLGRVKTLKLVVLPQALRIITPPLTNQYLNLAKNSSLAIAVGFPDLFNVGNTIMNQTGQSIPVFAMIMGSYLIMSLITSLFLNWYNIKATIVER
jgi:general L-amino acid transport system permease protein